MRRFVIQTAGGYRSADASIEFTSRLLKAFGWADGCPPDAAMPAALAIVNNGERTSRTVPLLWKARRVLVDVVQHEVMLDFAWKDLLRACLQVDPAPQYVVLTNQRDLYLYDLARDRAVPRLAIPVDDLPKYSEAFPFLEPEWSPGTTPRIIDVGKVTKEVADLVAKVYRALAHENPKRTDDVIRFTLQCIVAMFAEDIGLIPKAYFTNLLYSAGEKGGAEAKLTELFTWMSTPLKLRTTRSAAIPYFNGGLFTNAISLSLSATVLRALTKASEANWTAVDPHIFGSVFQGVMDDAERHASGAHYTAREDIMSVVGPTVVEPWRERIEGAKTLEDLKCILRDLTTYRVLDPACGSGNFLYISFRELYRIETEVLARIYDEFPSATRGKGKISWASGIRTTNFFGIDINPFAVALAKTTLNIAKKIAFEQRKEEVIAKFGLFPIEVDPSLPLDNLDENIVCADALFTEWPEADAIVGNPPFLGAKKFIEQLGQRYHSRLGAQYPDVPGLADLSTYWFRRAHSSLKNGCRAGLIANSTVRFGATSRGALEFIRQNRGTIYNAVAQKDWPGDAAVMVSIVNWKRGSHSGKKTLVVGGVTHTVAEVSSRLSLVADVTACVELKANESGTGEGINYGTKEIFLPCKVARRLASDPSSANVVCSAPGGAELVSGSYLTRPRWALFFGNCALDRAKQARVAFEYASSHLEPVIRKKSTLRSNAAWYERWWQPRRYKAIYEFVNDRARTIGCSQTMARPIFFFLSTAFRPANSVQLFACDDDYSFGVIQSALHWAWTLAMGGRMKSDIRYRSKVWKTFPWPQEPTLRDAAAVGQAAQQLRATRQRLMDENGWSLRELHRSAEVDGPHPLKDAQAALDAAVEAAYGKPADQDATEFLLEMNLALAEDEAAGHTIQGPGLPRVNGRALEPKDPRWFSTDCIEPPPYPGAGSPKPEALAD